MAAEGIKISRAGADEATINSAIAIGVGSVAGLTATAFKSNKITYLIGLAIDLIVSAVIDNKLSSELKTKIKNELITALDSALNGKNGLYQQIKAGIDKFHKERADEISRAMKV